MAYLDSAVPSTDPGPDKGKDAKKPSELLRKYWREVEAYNKASTDWKEQSEKIVKLYLDQHRTAASPRRFALLWSNIETLKPAVYGKIPTVLCSRRYKDAHPVGRTAAELLERATNTTFDLYGADEVFRMVRDDRLLIARGQAWVRYEADFKKTKDDNGAEYDKVSGEKVCIDYVNWPDFGHNVAGTWKDVWLVWRMVYKTRDEVEKRFSAKIAEKLNYSAQVDAEGKQEAGEHTARIYEVWDRKRGKTVFMSRDCPDLIEDGDPPLNFRDFFPCPEPCYGSKTGKSLIPTPDYRYYQDQANEIDDLTDKIANLTESLQLKAFVPAGPSADGGDAVRIMIQMMQSETMNNKTLFVPVESWAGFTEKGGAGRLIDWLPIDMVIKALQGAVETRNQLIQDVYQITGIADILRGQTDPDETLGAQQLKAQTGQKRVKNTKDELARFCCDIGQLVAEVIAEQFQPQTIADMTGYSYQPGHGNVVDPAQQMAGPQIPQAAPAPMLPQMAAPPMQPGMTPQQSPSGQMFDDRVMELLRSDRMRGFLIDIETDSTIQPDEDAEKQRRTEFLTAVGGFMREATQVLSAPGGAAIAPMLSEMLLFMVRGFRAGRNLEEVIERSMQQLQQQLQQAQANPPPDPKMEAEKIKAQAAAQKAQADMALVQTKHQAEMEKMQGEQAKMRAELQFMMQKLGMQQQEASIKLQGKQQEAQIDAENQARDAAAQERQRALDAEASAREHAQNRETADHKHGLGMEVMEAKAEQAKQRPAN